MTMVVAKTQTEQVINHLRSEGSISAIEASALYRIRSLSSRISELKNEGYDIVSERKTDVTGQRYVRYHLVKKRKVAKKK